MLRFQPVGQAVQEIRIFIQRTDRVADRPVSGLSASWRTCSGDSRILDSVAETSDVASGGHVRPRLLNEIVDHLGCHLEVVLVMGLRFGNSFARPDAPSRGQQPRECDPDD